MTERKKRRLYQLKYKLPKTSHGLFDFFAMSVSLTPTHTHTHSLTLACTHSHTLAHSLPLSSNKSLCFFSLVAKTVSSILFFFKILNSIRLTCSGSFNIPMRGWRRKEFFLSFFFKKVNMKKSGLRGSGRRGTK